MSDKVGRTKREDLERELKQMEAKWLAADARINEAHAVLECAQEKYSKGNEAVASLLMDGAFRILNSYFDDSKA